jgi:hypothetical protein
MLDVLYVARLARLGFFSQKICAVTSGGTCSTIGTRVTSPSLLQKIFSELNE